VLLTYYLHLIHRAGSPIALLWEAPVKGLDFDCAVYDATFRTASCEAPTLRMIEPAAGGARISGKENHRLRDECRVSPPAKQGSEADLRELSGAQGS
jgi:hypothetical protein